MWSVYCIITGKRYHHFLINERMNNVKAPTAIPSATMAVRQPTKVPASDTFQDLLAAARASSHSGELGTDSTGPVMLVGKISAENPTVSELLIQHEELGQSTWDIIYSRQNQDKDYTKIKAGTSIYYNRETAALYWSDPLSDALKAGKTQMTHSQLHPHISGYASSTVSAVNSEMNIPTGKQISSPPAAEVIQLGKIDSSNPTVSHLLKNHPQLKANTWNILADDINKGKPFERITSGTEILINVKNSEIVWNGADNTVPVSRHGAPADPETKYPEAAPAISSHRPAANLSEAVQQYLGRSYDEMNCYELVVKGLRQMDIPYGGKDGLYSKLTRMAVDRGLAPNAYLNGEGIIKAAGSLVLSRNYTAVSNWQSETAALVRDIEPLLDNGQILSFSTEKRGHTGVISQKNNQWTFINSGRLDNAVNRSSLNHGVGEEVLTEEIGNWFKTAQEGKETLTVTLGRLEQTKTQTAYNPRGSISGQI